MSGRVAMSRVESPFHAIAAQALDDAPDADEVNGGTIAVAAAGAAPPAAPTGSGGLAREPEPEPEPEQPSSESRAENGGRIEEEEAEDAAVPQERKGSVVVSCQGAREVEETVTKKSKKRTNVWTKTTSRKSARKNSVKNNGARPSDAKDDGVELKPFHHEDDPNYPILLSKTSKAEKVELSADRLSASGSKGYRMVRATRGVFEGAWYFEICVERLGETGHTRLGWSTKRGDIQAPVGYDTHSYAFRDVDGSKVHAALRQDYGKAYHEKDVIGFYINLPREPGSMPEADEVYLLKGQPYHIDTSDEPHKPLPGSEMLFFKNGVCEGVAFQDVNDGTYFPAASMYTLPSQDFCKVVFNFGPEFKYPPVDLGDRPIPTPMCQASCPGIPKPEAPPKSQAEAIGESADNGAAKHRMAAEGTSTGEIEEASVARREVKEPNEVVKYPVKKTQKTLKPPEGKQVPPPLSKKSKAGESRLNPDSKREFSYDAMNKNITGGHLQKNPIGGPLPTALPAKKGGTKITTGTNSQKLEGKQIPAGIISLKARKADPTGTAWKSMKGSKKGSAEMGLLNPKLNKDGPGGLASQRGTGLVASKGANGGMSGLGSAKGKVSKKPVASIGLQGLPAIKQKVDMSASSSRGAKRDLSGVGLPVAKRSKMDGSGQRLPLTVNKNLTATGSPKPGKKSLPPSGSSLKASKKDLPKFVRRGMGLQPVSGRRSWGDGIQGTTMDVAVVVVESSKG